MDTLHRTDKAKSGVPGLDDVMSGGFTRGSLFLVEGNPGTGKTTMALRFLLEGAALGERNLYVTLSETKSELLSGAASHWWTLDSNIEVFELQPAERMLDADQQQSLLYSSELELGETVKLLLDTVERIQPHRIVVDSLSEIRLLAQSSLRYRRQLLALKHYFARSDTTVLTLDDLTTDVLDKTAHSIAHGVIRLEELTPTYGAERRRMRARPSFPPVNSPIGSVNVCKITACERSSSIASMAIKWRCPRNNPSFCICMSYCNISIA